MKPNIVEDVLSIINDKQRYNESVKDLNEVSNRFKTMIDEGIVNTRGYNLRTIDTAYSCTSIQKINE